MSEVLGIYKENNKWVAVIYTATKRLKKTFINKDEAILQRLVWEIECFGSFVNDKKVINKLYPQLLNITENIKINNDINVVKKILYKLQEDNHCPCKIIKNKDTICMCREFREQENGWCHCHLFYKIK